MAATGTVSIGGTVTGLLTGTKTLSGSILSAAAVGVTTDVTLASGDNTVNVPTGTTAVLIQPPANNAAVLKLKGASGDTGVVLHPTFPTLLTLAAAQTTLIINASALTSSPTEFSFV